MDSLLELLVEGADLQHHQLDLGSVQVDRPLMAIQVGLHDTIRRGGVSGVVNPFLDLIQVGDLVGELQQSVEWWHNNSLARGLITSRVSHANGVKKN
jgi:hypothetical protein